MRREDYKKRVNILYQQYRDWFVSQRQGWGMYEISISPGWFSIIERLLADIKSALPPEKQSCFKLAQIKEKFGVMRVYYEYHDPSEELASNTEQYNPYKSEICKEISALISQATDESARTCLFCGDHGSLRKESWWCTVCDHHLDLIWEGKTLKDDFELMTTPGKKH